MVILRVPLLAVLVAAGCASNAENKPTAGDASNVHGKIFRGWETFHASNCEWCHGRAGDRGPAPSLVQRLKIISKDEFISAITNGHNDMPAWKSDPLVMQNLDNVYAYLKARSDGTVGEAPPAKP
jgi:mono/diheme cytochrome c family protein